MSVLGWQFAKYSSKNKYKRFSIVSQIPDYIQEHCVSFGTHTLTVEFETSGDLIALYLKNASFQKEFGKPLKIKEITLSHSFNLAGELDDQQMKEFLVALARVFGHLSLQINQSSLSEMMTTLLADVNKGTESLYKILKGKDLDTVISVCLSIMREIRDLFKFNPERCQIIETIIQAKLMYLRNFPGYAD